MTKRKKTIADPRPDWDTYFMEIARVTAMRANCSRRKVAAVVVSDNRIISTGYNGTPRGVTNCFAGGCARCAGTAPSGSSLEECICVHAEQNAICQAAYYGTRLAGATIYVTISPCLTCAKLIINAGIKEVVYDGDYAFTEQTERLLQEAGVTCRRYVSGAGVCLPASQGE
ncbi:MAG TPA: dCMP deaminase family protein [Kiritimatiellia bacterium]|jgi:dCMP deaminase|nr:dCMP deaminase family protein [Kiritimatiellia bacterium]HOR97325.1 dCMP deaminase family protein [Kiritimatiellia bacterium]HPK37445.1 dCMP deaminase family protein [Kiritimatiellia bacterium]HPW75383.1 dCMP deaminase family protein [Kiritimatiellia bacterium]